MIDENVIEEKLKNYILKKYKTISAFSKEINVPNTTISSILKRGIKGSSVATIIEICNKLEIDVEELLNGNIISKKSIFFELEDNIQNESVLILTKEEQDLLLKFRKLNNFSKKNVKFILENEFQRFASEDLQAIARKKTDNNEINSYKVNKNIFLKKIKEAKIIEDDEEI